MGMGVGAVIREGFLEERTPVFGRWEESSAWREKRSRVSENWGNMFGKLSVIPVA